MHNAARTTPTPSQAAPDARTLSDAWGELDAGLERLETDAAGDLAVLAGQARALAKDIRTTTEGGSPAALAEAWDRVAAQVEDLPYFIDRTDLGRSLANLRRQVEAALRGGK